MLASLQPVALWAGQAAMQLQRWAAGRLAAAGAGPGAAPAAGERAGMQHEAHEWLEARRPRQQPRRGTCTERMRALQSAL